VGTILRPVVFAAIVSLPVMRSAGGPAQMIAIATGYVSLMLLLTGGQTMRNDLRTDMQQLPLIKTLPLSGRDLVLAEVLSPALPLTAVQLVLLSVGAIALSFSTTPLVSADVRVALMIVAPFAVLAANFAMLTLSNGLVVLFPAWMRLGPHSAGGFELVGQAMAGMLGMFLTFLVLLAVPAAAAWLVFAALPASFPVIIASAIVVAAVLLALETYGLIVWLGRRFERVEPTAMQ
jgi:hypothetical protein